MSDYYSIHSSSNCPLSKAPPLWLCTVTPQSANQDPISRGRLWRSTQQDTRNPPFPLHQRGFFFFSVEVWSGPHSLTWVVFTVHCTSLRWPSSCDSLHNKCWFTLLSAIDCKQHRIGLLLWLFILAVPACALIDFIDAIYSLQHHT